MPLYPVLSRRAAGVAHSRLLWRRVVRASRGAFALCFVAACGSSGVSKDGNASTPPGGGGFGNMAATPEGGGGSSGAPPGAVGNAEAGAGANAPASASGAAGSSGATGGSSGVSIGGANGEVGGANVGGANIGGANGGTQSGGAAGSAGGVSSLPPKELLLYDDSGGRLMYVNNAKPSVNWSSNSGAGRDLQLVGGGRAMLGKSDGWDEYRLTDGMKVGGEHGFPGTEDAYRLADGRTMLASVSGTSIQLKFVNAAGVMQGQISYPGYGYVRLVRPTSAGTYLVSADSVVFEGTEQGAVIWHVSPPGGRHVWKALRLSNGNTVMTTGYGATLVVYDSSGKLLQTIGGVNQASAAQIAPWFYADFHVLASGQYFLVNSQADRNMPSSVQLLAYDASGTLVWQQKQPAGVRTLEAAIVLDGLDTSKLNVEPQGRLISAP